MVDFYRTSKSSIAHHNKAVLTRLTSCHSGELPESGGTWNEVDSQWVNVQGRYLKHARRVLGFGKRVENFTMAYL